MKTLKMKNSLLAMIAIIFSLSIITLPIMAQDEEKKIVKIKTIKVVDGEKTVIDTTYEITDLEELEKLENIHVIINDEMMKDLELSLEELEELKDIDFNVMMDSDSITKHVMVITKKLEDMHGDLEEQMEKIEVMIEMSDSLPGKKTIIMKMDGDGETVYIVNGEDMEDMKWVEEGEGNVMIIKTTDGDMGDFDIDIDSDTDGEMVFYKINCEGEGEGKQEILVDVFESKDREGISIKTKIVICSPNEKDIDKLDKAGIELAPKATEEKLKLKNLSFYPNPSSGKFTLKFKTSKNEKSAITIYDVNGTEVYSETVKGKDGVYEKEIDISNEQKGTYFLKISQGEKVSTKKIILD